MKEYLQIVLALFIWPVLIVTGAVAFSVIAHRKGRYSLRTLLIATTMIAVVLGVIAYATRQ